MPSNKVVMFMGFANGVENDSLESLTQLEMLKEEEANIGQALDEVRNLELCELRRNQELTPESLQEYVQQYRHKTQIFHFSGHANGSSILLYHGEYDENIPVDKHSLAEMLKTQTGLKLVFLNGCETSKLGDALIEAGIPAVICSKREVLQEEATKFAVNFYKSLASGSTLGDSFVVAENADKIYSHEVFNPAWELKTVDTHISGWNPFGIHMKNKETLNILQLSGLDTKERLDQFLSYDFSILYGKIDFIVYTGGISGTYKKKRSTDDFAHFKQVAKDHLDVPPMNIVLCPGKSDIEHSPQENSVIRDHLNSLTSNECLTDFSESGDEFNLSCSSYSKYQKQIQYITGMPGDQDKYESLYTLHVRTVGNKKIGFVSINSFWNTFDEGQFVFPSHLLHDAHAQHLSSCDLRILISHRDLSALKPFNRKEIEAFVYANFDIVCCGPKEGLQSKEALITNEGVFYSYSGLLRDDSPSIIYHQYDWEKDYVQTHLSLDLDTCLVESTKRLFQLPRGAAKNQQIKLINSVNDLLNDYHQQGLELFLNRGSSIVSFQDGFVKPVVKEKSLEEIELARGRKGEVTLNRNKYEEVLNSSTNYLIYGKDKSGKSILLTSVAIYLLERFGQSKTISLLIDLEQFKHKPDRLNILNLIVRKLECNKKTAELYLSKYHFRFLFDNFDPSNATICTELSAFFSKYRKASYVICADQTILRTFDNLDFGFNHFSKLYIHEVSKSEIRSLVKKHTQKSDAEVDQIVQRLIAVFRQYRMPFNFWTVSVFLWILSRHKYRDFEVQNNSELMVIYIQELLGQRELAYTADRNRFTFEKYKKYLSYLARMLYENHEGDVYSTGYENLVRYTQNFLDRSKRNVASPREVLDYVMKRGILRRVTNTYYAFRLNGAFEYFLANEMLESPDFLDSILNDETKYLAFQNELDLYSGFVKENSRDLKLLKSVFQIAQEKYIDLNNYYDSIGGIDNLLTEIAGSDAETSLKVLENVKVEDLESLSYEEKDLLETSLQKDVPIDSNLEDVVIKKEYNKDSSTIENLEGHLFIMSRVYRNIDVENTIEEDAFRFILDSTCSYGFKLIENLATDISENDSKFGFSRKILDIFNILLPLIVQELFYLSVGHITLERIILSCIDKLSDRREENQFKLFVLYFTLVDLDLRSNKKYLDNIIELTKLGTLKISVLSKIFQYLIFQAYDKEDLQKYLKKKAREVQLNLNPRTDIDRFNKKLSNIDRISIVKKSAE